MKISALVAPNCYLSKRLLYSKWTFIMRISLLFLWCVLVSAHLLFALPGKGQDIASTKVTVGLKDRPLLAALKQIENHTPFRFAYVEAELHRYQHTTLPAKLRTVKETLDELFATTDLTYKVSNRTIGIVKKKQGTELSRSVPAVFTDNDEWQDTLISVRGQVVDSAGKYLPDVTVTVKGSAKATISNESGNFEFRNISSRSIFVFSHIGYKPAQVAIDGKKYVSIVLSEDPDKGVLTKVEVVSTGYQQLNKRSATGSFDVVDNELFNRKVSTNILDRIENLTPGLSFNTPNETSSENPSGILIRGRNSIFSSVAPLIVVDNFPYDGDIRNLNPNDVENITILKDAAAAAQWGARAGNGVIVITTKKGKTLRPQLDFNSNLTIQDRPNLFKMPVISSADAIEVEKWLFNKGYYNTTISNTTTRPPLSPVQEILLRLRNNQITQEEADALITPLKSIDTRTDLEKYFYRISVNSQQALNISGNNPFLNYYMSVGWDKNLPNLVGQESNRITFRNRNVFKVTDRFSIEAGINYVQNLSAQGDNPGIGISSSGGKLYPYADLVGDDGSARILVKDYRQLYTDTAGNGKLLDWKYRPYDEISNTENKRRISDFVFNNGLRYSFQNGLVVDIKYQFQNSLQKSNNLATEESYTTRSMINRFYQPNAATVFPVPVGGILDVSTSELISHQGRAQLSYTRKFGSLHGLTAIAGWEIKDQRRKGESYRLYGYSKEGSKTNNMVDFVTQFVQYNNPNTKTRIANPQRISSETDRFLSAYVNSSYSYANKYFVSASVRSDAANLFGVRANQRGVPLWSAGLSWIASNESFYSSGLLPYLKFRATYGYTGNFSRLASALATVKMENNSFGVVSANVESAPNENLRWEKVQIANLGLDFGFKGDRLTGSIEVYKKKHSDLMAQAPIDPTTGLSPLVGAASFYGNVAHMKGHGVDLELQGVLLDNAIKWQANVIASYAATEITEYLMPASTSASTYLGNGSIITPQVGKPIYVFYSYSWGGLDATGDPVGYLNREKSKNWSKIVTDTKQEDLVYNGPVQPQYFGSFRNTLSWKNTSLSINTSIKAGYYLRMPSISYTDLYSTWTGHSDFSKRWQKPGDELSTSIPSMVYTDYPLLSGREAFYASAEILVVKADNIRIEDIAVSQTFYPRNKLRQIEQIRCYLYLSNINAFLWRNAGKAVNPYLPNGAIVGKSVSLGVNIKL